MRAGAERAAVTPSLLEHLNSSVLVQCVNKSTVHKDIHLAELRSRFVDDAKPLSGEGKCDAGANPSGPLELAIISLRHSDFGPASGIGKSGVLVIVNCRS